MRKLLTIACSVLMIPTLYAVNNNDGGSSITLDPYNQLRVHRASNINFSITNYGKLGSEARRLYDPETQLPAPSAEYPADTDLEQLFQGCLWIGAIVERPDEPGVFDTLVSIGDDGWAWDIHELNPTALGSESLWEDQLVGDQEFYAVYYDTVTVGVTPDGYDNRDHIPLGLKIIQHSLCWSSPGYDEFFVIEYQIENIYNRVLNDVWLGLFIDGDVLHTSEPQYQDDIGAQDDLCGFIELDDRGIAWIADNNGQPEDGAFNAQSSRNVMGMVLLGSSTPGLQTNFNWWISNVDQLYDWGPQWQSNFDIWGTFPGGGKGTPNGDIAKYQVMSNAEHDYDQVFCNLDHTDEGWIESAPNSETLANGYDTRYLISLGPLQFGIGAVETVTVAYIGGANLHLYPDNYWYYLEHNTDDSLSIVEFYNNLDFTDLIAKPDTALHYYQIGFEAIPPGPPTNFHVENWSSEHVTLSWEPRFPDYLQEYRIYRGTEPGVYDSTKITPDDFIDTIFTDTNVEDNTYYYYVITTVNIAEGEGVYSYEQWVNTGQPLTPVSLTATRGNAEIDLYWEANPENDIYGYIIYRVMDYADSEFNIIDTSSVNSYLDTGLANGHRYYYTLQALDIYDNVSFFTDTVSAIPMGFDSGILLINTNREGHYYPDYDSIVVFYHNMLENASIPYAVVDQPPDSLAELSPYHIVVWCHETPRSRYYFRVYDHESSLFANYLDAGGKLIVAGTRNVMTSSQNNQGLFEFSQNGFFYRHLNLYGIELPDWTTTEFIGGESASSNFMDFDVDTVRANRIAYPPFVENDGRLLGIGALIPRDSNEVIYNFRAVLPDTSNYHGRPVGIIHHGDNYSIAALEFPLYYVEEPLSFEIFNNILLEFEGVGIEDQPAAALPEKTTILQNYPNPFNAATVIKYTLSEPGPVKINIYNILGQHITTLVDDFRQTGIYSVNWQANDLPSGIYFARLTRGDNSESIKMLLLK